MITNTNGRISWAANTWSFSVIGALLPMHVVKTVSIPTIVMVSGSTI